MKNRYFNIQGICKIMFFRPKVGKLEEKVFNQETYEQELKWLTKIKNGEILETKTSPEKLPAIMTAIIATLFLGGTTGAMISVFAKSILPALIIPPIAFLIAYYLSLKPYSNFFIDLTESLMEYNGGMLFAGEVKRVNYRGPIEVIEGTQLIQHSRSKKAYIRFLTNSGYMRINHDVGADLNILKRLEELQLLNFEEMQMDLQKKTEIKRSKQWIVRYEKLFDRSEFKQKLREGKKRAEEKRKIDLEEKRKKLIAKSKERLLKEQTTK